MASTSSTLLSLSLCSLFLFHITFAQIQEQHSWGSQGQAVWGSQGQQGPRQRAKTDCRIEQLTAQEPNQRIQSENGEIHFWDSNRPEFVCAGVEFVRYIIRPQGLLIPGYSSAPQMVHIVQGRGILGTVFPGCAETFESESQAQRGQRFTDRHQKLRRYREGDIAAVPVGVTNWVYNDGDRDLIAVVLIDTSNHANQLDNYFRKFFLAGNPQQGQQGQKGQQQDRGFESPSILNGFDEQIIADALNISPETARRLTNQQDQRGFIVRAEKMRLIAPEFDQQEEHQYYGRGSNGLVETFCTMKLITNIDDPRRADVYNPQGGRITNLNSNKFPILNYLQLSAEKGVLHGNAIMAPHWNMNAHSIIYVVRGRGRIQVVGHRGNSVFDGQVEQGRVLVVPQNFAVIKQAGNEGFEWIAFKTNDNAVTTQIAGRTSALRGMPEEVLMNSFQISREDARNLKYNRREISVFSPRRSQQGYKAYA